MPSADVSGDVQVTTFDGYPMLNGRYKDIIRYLIEVINDHRSGNTSSGPLVSSTLNAHKYYLAKENPDLREKLLKMDFLRADGMPIVWFSGFFDQYIPERASSSDLIFDLVDHADHELDYYLLGAREQVLERAVHNLRANHSNVRVSGSHHGYFPDEKSEEIVRQINQANVDLLWVGMGVPKEQRWVVEWEDRLDVPLVMTCGGAFKHVAGTISRPSETIQNLGLEWSYRLLSNPSKVWKRYLIGNTKFLLYLHLSLLNNIMSGR